MAHAQNLSEFVEADDGGIALAAFKVAHILLAEARAGSDLLLRQSLFPTQARKVPADQHSHIHASVMAVGSQ